MKLFVITSRIPFPLDKGDKLRIYHQLKELSKHHKIYLCAIKSPLSKEHKISREVLNEFCEEVYFINQSLFLTLFNLLKSFFNALPFQTALFTEFRAKKRVNHLIDKIEPDHIYCQLTRAAEYVKDRKEAKTLDYMDAFSKGMERRALKSNIFTKWLYKLESLKQKNYEKTIFEVFDTHIIISEEDKKHINHPKRDQIHIVPNGVDFNHFSPKNAKPKYDLVFVGNMGYAPNVDAAVFLCRDILPKIHEKIPNAKILIAGAQPTIKVTNLKSDHVKVSGWIEDIRNAYSESKIFIAPMRMGTGLQNKLLEAMAMEKACITTPIANNTLKAPEGTILVGETVEELTQHCIHLIENESVRNKCAKEGKKFVERTYKWTETTERLNKLFLS
tara:strand:- start:1850 stop:3013 length:1164 start_codon:yes stop_codon:yes gene_type:complete